MVSLIQVATSLPMFLFALPAGALADIVDRRRMLLVTQAYRSAVSDRFAELDSERVESQIRIVMNDLERQSEDVAIQLDRLAETMDADNDLRLGLAGAREDLREAVRDFAPRQMAVMDLDMLLLQDDTGRTLSSGHFRSSYDALDPAIPRLLARASGGRALLQVRTPQGSFLALARSRPVNLGGKTYHLTGGATLDEQRLRDLDRDGDLALGLVWPGGGFATADWLADELRLGRDPDRDVLEAQYVMRRRGLLVRTEHLTLVSNEGSANAWLVVNGVDRESTLFAGDSGNDLDVLASPIPAVLVANATAEVRAAAHDQAEAHGTTSRLYIARGDFADMNGNYAAGILEGLAHFWPETRGWIR